VGRSSWFAIRAPLASRRATVAKFAAFLLPLALWALVCLVWLPEVVITDQGDGSQPKGKQVTREEFETENARIRALPPEYRVTPQALQSMQGDVPEPVIAKIREKVGPNKDNPTGFAFKDQKMFLASVQPIDRDITDDYQQTIYDSLEKDPKTDPPQRRLTEASWKSLESEFAKDILKKLEPLKPKLKPEGGVDTFSCAGMKELLQELAAISFDPEFTPYVAKAWTHLEKETKKEEQGEPATREWLPPPWRVARAFYVAFVTPPVGAGYKVNSENNDKMQKHGVPEAVLAKLNALERKSYDYEDKGQFIEALGKTLAPEELHNYQKTILKDTYVQTDPWLHQSLWRSCETIFWGFFISALIGVPLGIVCGTFDFFAKLTEPFVDFIRYMPAPAFGVACMAILGIGLGPKIAIIWIGTFFQMVLVVANTTRQFDPALLEAAQTLGASKRSLLLKVILPGILPNLYNDMRILLGWAWTYLIVAELVGAQSGISEFIYREGLKYHHFDRAYAGIIMIGIIGLTCDQILAALARFLFPWVPKSSRGAGAWAAFFGALAYMLKGGRKTSTVAGTAQA